VAGWAGRPTAAARRGRRSLRGALAADLAIALALPLAAASAPPARPPRGAGLVRAGRGPRGAALEQGLQGRDVREPPRVARAHQWLHQHHRGQGPPPPAPGSARPPRPPRQPPRPPAAPSLRITAASVATARNGVQRRHVMAGPGGGRLHRRRQRERDQWLQGRQRLRPARPRPGPRDQKHPPRRRLPRLPPSRAPAALRREIETTVLPLRLRAQTAPEPPPPARSVAAGAHLRVGTAFRARRRRWRWRWRAGRWAAGGRGRGAPGRAGARAVGAVCAARAALLLALQPRSLRRRLRDPSRLPGLLQRRPPRPGTHPAPRPPASVPPIPARSVASLRPPPFLPLRPRRAAYARPGRQRG